MRRLSGPDFALGRERMEALWTSVDQIALTERVARRAGDLAQEHGLRAYDAVHLASFERAAGPETVLVSGDRDLVTAAQTAGFSVAPV
jgi:predicted nucleic acid-binding protein